MIATKKITGLLFLIFFPAFGQNLLAQQTGGVRALLDPVVQKHIIDVAVNDQQKRLATLEIGGTIHVYDLNQRKILFFTTHNEEEMSEGGTHQSKSKRLVRFDDSGDLLGIFNKENGFTLHHAATGDTLLELKWKTASSGEVYETPLPYDLKFLGNYLLLRFGTSGLSEKNYDNNSFIIDIKKGRLITVFGKQGFNCTDDLSENENNARELSIYADQPKKILPVNIYWNRKPIKFSKAAKAKGLLLITPTSIKNVRYDQPDVPEEEEEEVEPEIKTLPLDELKKFTAEDSLLHKRLRAAIKQNNDWKTLFGSIDQYEEMYAAIDSLQFSLVSADRISDYDVRKFGIENSYFNMIEVLKEGKPIQYFLEQKTTNPFRFKNAYFIHTVRKFTSQNQYSHYWQLLWPGANGMQEIAAFSQQKNYDVLSGIIESYSGNKIAWGVNEGRNVIIYGLDLNTGKLKKIQTLASAGINEKWIRNDWAMGDFRQLNVYRFIDDDYFFIQGLDIGHNNLLFETTHWTKLIDQPVAGNTTTGSKYAATKNLFISNGKLLLDNEQTWEYGSNLFEPFVFNQNPDNYDYDYDNIQITDYKTLDQNFLKKIRLRYDSGKIILDDGEQYIETTKDANNRIKWVHHAGELRLEYYPHLNLLDMGHENMDAVKINDPNYYADAELAANIRLTAGNGKQVILQSPFGASRGYFKAGFSDDKAFVFSLSGHNYIDVWKSVDGTYLATVIPYGKNDALIIDKNGYNYTTNPASLRNLYLRFNNTIYPAEELDIYMNRPDTILQALSFIKNDALTSFYKDWVQRRQRAAGIFENDFSKRPVVHIETTGQPLATDTSALSFTFSVSHFEPVEKVFLLINNVLTDSLEMPADSVKAGFIAALQKGSNKIQLIAQARNGLRSFRETFYTNYEPLVPGPSSIKGVAMGVSEYENENYTLDYAAKDAADISKAINSLPAASIVELLNKDVNAHQLNNAAEQLKGLKQDDIAIIYLAGHGALDKKGQFYFCTSETDLAAPEHKGISMQALQNFFSQTKARRRLLILDACHSGTSGLQQQTEDTLPAKAASLKGRGNIVINRTNKSVNNISIRNYTEMLKQQLYDAGSNDGVHVFSATSGAGLAYESDQWKNGVFTMKLINGLLKSNADKDNNAQIELSELIHYVIDEVNITTKGLQLPEATLIRWDNNWVLIE